MTVYISILISIIFSQFFIILKMKRQHIKELEYYINRYWDVEEELFQHKKNELEKENEDVPTKI